MSSIPDRPRTQGAAQFDPDDFFERWGKRDIGPPGDEDLRGCIINSFGLSPTDSFQYRATSSFNLLQTQKYIEYGPLNGLHAWYRDDQGNERTPSPSPTDIDAYNAIFHPGTQTANALKALAANAKKGSIRWDIGEHLQSLYRPPAAEKGLAVSKNKAHVNPYLDVLEWANRNVSWAGPEAGTVRVKHSHAILPILYHHFGCVCPSYEALSLILQLARGRRIVDLGSGNGYWTYMLRRLHTQLQQGRKSQQTLDVVPVDNGMSEWRTVWVGDTSATDGLKWLQKQRGARDDLLLLVYPNTGEQFTSRMIGAYEGSTIVGASTQNASGFTSFANETLAQWMARERPDFEQVLQIPLPSFAGTDEALFAFERRSAGH